MPSPESNSGPSTYIMNALSNKLLKELRSELGALNLGTGGEIVNLDEIMWDVEDTEGVGDVVNEKQGKENTPTKISRGVGTDDKETDVGQESVGFGAKVTYNYNYNYHYHYRCESFQHSTEREGTRNVGGC